MLGQQCLCFAVQRASRMIGRRYDEALRSVGLTNWQFSMLVALNKAEPPSVGRLAETLAMDRTTIATNLKPLERRGLVAVAPDPEDRRVHRLHLTDAGRTLLAEAVPLWQTVNDAVTAGIGATDLPTLKSALSRLRDA